MSILPAYFYRPTKDIRDELNVVADIIERERKTIEDLRSTINDMESEAYKDSELARMRAELDEAKADLYRGFGISKDESKAIAEWIENHENTYHNGNHYHGVSSGGYEYIFYPTGIGTAGEIRCSSCGKRFQFQEIG